jgi:hypothetical protein
LTRLPSAGVETRTTSPTAWLKPWPGPNRSIVGREHGAEKQHHAVRILVMCAHRLFDQVQRVAADL